MKRKRCTKRSYSTKTEAEAAIAAMFRRFGAFVYKKVYRCGKCRAWHITSRPWGGRKRVQH